MADTEWIKKLLPMRIHQEIAAARGRGHSRTVGVLEACREEITNSRTEIERLRAAGDAVVDAVFAVSVGGLPDDMDTFISAIDAWREARRG